jgi:hypothetical protein
VRFIRTLGSGSGSDIGGPEELGNSVDAQRAQVAAFAKAIGFNPI